MAEVNSIYKCRSCGHVVEVLHAGVGDLVCCDQPMELQKANTVDAAQEKHVPVVEATDGGIKVRIGSVPHPMETEHYIEWIEAIAKDGRVMRKSLKPGDAPEADFCLGIDELAVAREHCNLHGLWQTS